VRRRLSGRDANISQPIGKPPAVLRYIVGREDFRRV
jgi:hypothetical protein